MASPPKDAPVVLITGAGGTIGRSFAEYAQDRYRLRLMIVPGHDRAKIEGFGEIVEADLADLESLKKAFVGVDRCVHLAGDPNAGDVWDKLLPDNIVGTYNVFAAAVATKCERVIFASSIHAVSGYPNDVQVKANEPVNPGDIYGVTKCFGEALARYVAEQEGVSGVAIRICAFQPDSTILDPNGVRIADAWISPRDMGQLICKCLDATHVKFAIVHGISDCKFKRLDITNARELFGYAPEDDAFEVNPDLKPLHLAETVITHSHADDKDKAATSGMRNQLNPKE